MDEDTILNVIITPPQPFFGRKEKKKISIFTTSNLKRKNVLYSNSTVSFHDQPTRNLYRRKVTPHSTKAMTTKWPNVLGTRHSTHTPTPQLPKAIYHQNNRLWTIRSIFHHKATSPQKSHLRHSRTPRHVWMNGWTGAVFLAINRHDSPSLEHYHGLYITNFSRYCKPHRKHYLHSLEHNLS